MMPRCTTLRRRPARGFTLVELLVAMSILAIILVSMLSALRTMAQAETKIAQHLERQDELRVARNFLKQSLTRISATKVQSSTALGKSEILFKASEQSIAWVGILPARPTVGGRYFFRLALEPDDQRAPGTAGDNLVLRFTPWQQDAPWPDWATAEQRVLLTQVVAFEVEGQSLMPAGKVSDGTWPQGWQAGWPVADVPPQAIKLQVGTAAHPEPAWWIFPIKALPHTDGSMSRVVIGGGAG
jgi:general secretion pathway protein J